MFAIIAFKKDVKFDISSHDSDFPVDKVIGNFEERIIATFDKEENAKDYIKNSSVSEENKNFHDDSLLRECISARVEEYKMDQIPHNPVFRKENGE